MSWSTRLTGTGRRRLLASAAAVLLAAAGTTLAVGMSEQHHAPRPSASAALPTAGTPSAAPGTTSTPDTRPDTPPGVPPVPAPPSSPAPPASATPPPAPTAIGIPAIGVQHTLLSLGQNTDGTLQVPPISDVSFPGWDHESPAPGQQGPAIVLGHIDGLTGEKGVFYSLGALHRGDTVNITRADQTVAVFRIDGVNEYSKDSFPTLTVYGNTPNAQLRLITCGGRFDHHAQHYLDNIVVFATLTGIHPA
ncbi:MAG: class F sortase [Catenulispora sp.]|nr:class F sortase [Catenulispora sp.]